PAAIIGLSLGVMIAGMSVFNVAVFEPVVTVQEWLWLLALVAAGLSVSHLLAGFALSGLGRQVYAPVLRLDHGLPYFSVDVRDAFMGGRMTEVCVALQTLAGPFVLAVVAGLWDLPNALLASWLTMLILTSPFGHTPAHNILHALFRKEYELPKCAERFLNTKMVAQMFNWRETLHEERYFLAYSTYAILWLGLVYRFASRMLETQGNAFADLLTRTGAPSGRWTMLVVFTLLALFVAAPLAYGAWVLLRGGYRLLAPRLFNAESALRRRPDGSHRPETAQVTRFLANTLLFSQLPLEELEKVAAAMKFIRVEPGTFLVRERDFGNLLFIVHTGSVEVLKENEAGEPLRVATLGAGDVFGEIGLLDEVPRTSSVRSTGAATLFTLKKEDFERLLVQTLGAKKIKEIVQVCAFLKRNPLFAEWHPQPLLRLSGAFAFQDFNPGDVVIQENKPNDSFYLVHDGQFEVRKKGQPCATLGPGDFCGEISLLRHTPATAEVAAVKPGRCLKLGKNDFFQLVSQSFLTGLTIETALDARTAKGGLRWARS
ncbi:MAG: cyclic nucleotide-binding domain-containing protein, partial [Verrucomicrobia bacterium]|nr:cyclic nucleotide-binding domain-containing protein [Verrucomicrobiota bacterium]